METESHTLAWDQEQQRLTVRENPSQKIIQDVELATIDFEKLRQALDDNMERERKLADSNRGVQQDLS